jgi:23S rRNA pseudouridine1911/1915/1917 synthase
MRERVYLEVGEEFNKTRLDDFLFEKISSLSRMYLRELIKTEKCEVNGGFENAGRKLKTNDFVELEIDSTRGTAMRPEDIPLDIVFEDNFIVVVNKPTGVLVHPTHRDKNRTLLNGLTFHLNRKRTEGGSIRAGLVHRLDKQTSGLMVVAKTVPIHRVLAEHFKRKLVDKRYIALVEGIIKNNTGLIEAPIGRYAELKLWNVKHDGKHASTRYWVRQRNADTTLVELEPVTGRTNQLRIHCSSIGHSIVGDTIRGGRPFDRLCLHAYKLSFKHPSTGEPLVFETSLPLAFNKGLSD